MCIDSSQCFHLYGIQVMWAHHMTDKAVYFKGRQAQIDPMCIGGSPLRGSNPFQIMSIFVEIFFKYRKMQ